MSAHRYEPSPLVDDGSSNLLLHTGRTIRDNLHILTGLSLLLLLIALPWFVIASLGSWLIVWIPLVLTIAPIWAMTIAAADQMLEGNAVALATLSTMLNRHARVGLEIAVLPALTGTLLLGSIVAIERAPDATWLLIPLSLGIGSGLASGFLLVPAFNVATRSGATGSMLWRASAYIVIARPSQVLGTLVIGGGIIWFSIGLGPAVLVLLAPLAVLISAVTRADSA